MNPNREKPQITAESLQNFWYHKKIKFLNETGEWEVAGASTDPEPKLLVARLDDYDRIFEQKWVLLKDIENPHF